MGAIRKEEVVDTPSGGGTPTGAKIGFTEKMGYGFGDLASNLVFAAVSTFLVFYYTDVAGASAAAVGTIILLSRLLDGFTDIGMGAIVDKTNSKHGKARPWLLWLAIPYTISAIMLFTVPDLGPVGMLVYIAITYNLVHIIYTGINIPYGVLNARMTQDSYQRATLNIFRMFSALIATVIVIFFTIPLVEAFGGGKTGWTVTFTIFGILAGILFLITFLTTKERVTAVNVDQSKVPVKDGVKALFKNKYWAMMVLFALVSYSGMGLGGGLGVYYAQYILGNTALVGPLGLAGLFPIMIGLLFVAPIIKKFGKRNAMIFGLLFGLIGTVVIMIDPSNFTLVIVGSIIRGLGAVPMAASFFAMLADTIEYGEWKTGLRTEGLVYSAGSFGTKVGMGLGAAIIGWSLSLGGYVGGVAEQTDAAIAMITFLFVWAPAIIALLQLAILNFYKLDKMYPQILADLQARKES
ncbi:GPH family glycoside/pentoside/hexuronide:cation symporter [Evansella vedderi]|uniref:GPH family glycoside/pentoside/hexuronide:cation symporter n=1 Tax=Evansella vedderi TaxID=38282 RepID=A0ABU0A0P7_9BACI|nr:MFS transporter [Evansella vedderi]MDQ0257054.1 GPH family glycoside/pentoside/hexuronide:cation symporter [Evansella vedderi]